MVVVLLTGMSGAGKSTALAGLARLGHATLDTDGPHWIELVDGEPLWRPDLIDGALDAPQQGPLFVLGTVANQGRWADRFDAVVLLTAPAGLLLERLRARRASEYGGTEQDRQRVLEDVATTEPRLRAMATHVLDTSAEPSAVVARLVEIAKGAGGPGRRPSRSPESP